MLNLGLNELSGVLNQVASQTVTKSVVLLCHSYKELLDLTIDYILKPENLNRSSSAMSAREMESKMIKMGKQMNRLKEVALLEPEKFLNTMRK